MYECKTCSSVRERFNLGFEVVRRIADEVEREEAHKAKQAEQPHTNGGAMPDWAVESPR